MSLLVVSDKLKVLKVHYSTDDVCAFTSCVLRRVYPYEIELWRKICCAIALFQSHYVFLSDQDSELVQEILTQENLTYQILADYLEMLEKPLSKIILERRLV
jgi:hypothetical protein